MFHSLLQFLDRYELAIDSIVWSSQVFLWGWFFWRWWHRFKLDVSLTADTPDHRFIVTITNRSRRTASIRKISLNVSSADLNRRARSELKARIEMSREVDAYLDSGESLALDLHHRQPNGDGLFPLRSRDLVTDLHDLGVELAELSVIIVDDKSQGYESNAVRIPVYQLVGSNGDNGLAEPGVIAG